MAAVGTVTVEVTVRITAEVVALATSHPGSEDAVDDLIGTLQVADHVDVVSSRVVPPGESGVQVRYRHGGPAVWTAVEGPSGWWSIKEWPGNARAEAAATFWREFAPVDPASPYAETGTTPSTQEDA